MTGDIYNVVDLFGTITANLPGASLRQNTEALSLLNQAVLDVNEYFDLDEKIEIMKIEGSEEEDYDSCGNKVSKSNFNIYHPSDFIFTLKRFYFSRFFAW